MTKTPIEAILAARGAQRPRIAPDGKTLYYCSDRDGRMQLWMTPVAGGPHTKLTDADRVGGYLPSPDGSAIAFGADHGGNEHWGIHIVPSGGGLTRDLTRTPDRIHHLLAWRSDGDAVFIATNRRDRRYFDVVELGLDGASRTVFEHDGTGGGSVVLEDGGLVVRTDRERSDRNHLTLVARDGRTRRLTPDQPHALHGVPRVFGRELLVRSDRGRDFVGVARISLDGAYEPVLAVDHDVDELDAAGGRWAYDLNVAGLSELHVVSTEDRSIDGLPPGALASDPFGESLTVAADGTVAVARSAFDRPNTIWLVAPDGRSRLAVDASMDGIAADDLPVAEVVDWPSFDGRRIPGFLLRRKDATGARPTIVQVHGGPEGQARPLWNPLTIALVAAGFAVLQPNVRGSSGYGREYMSLDDVRLRMDSVRDLDAAAAWLIERGLAPADRIGLVGGSYGGFMTLAGIAFLPERWRAAVAIVAIGRWRTFLERTDAWRRPLREAEYGTIERDAEFLESISPFNHLERIRAPLMVIHGANDPRVPVQESEQMVAALRDRGHDVTYLRYEDEGHGLAKAKNRADAWPRVVDFFAAKLMA